MKDNGATEIPGSSFNSKVIFFGSPIRHWWTKDGDGKTLHESELYARYSEFRENVRYNLSQDFLVFSPHLALKGPWNETVGNLINNTALLHSDAFVAIKMAGIIQEGTDRERDIAKACGIPTWTVPFGGIDQYDVFGEIWADLKEKLL